MFPIDNYWIAKALSMWLPADLATLENRNLIYPMLRNILNLLFCCFSLEFAYIFASVTLDRTMLGALLQWRRYLWPGIEDYQYPS